MLLGSKEDILTKALDSQEHAGRDSGVGGHVTPSQYFNTGKVWKTAVVEKELIEYKKLISSQDERIQKLEALHDEHTKKVEEMMLKKGSFDIDDKGSCYVHVQEIKIDKSVPLDEDLEDADLYVESKAETLQVNVELLMRPWELMWHGHLVVLRDEVSSQKDGDRLNAASANQIVMVPSNIGGHWILTVLEPYKDVVYLLDPLVHRICNDDLKYVVDM
ncbi:hypothetical protein F511_07285 [Dorcoceras hygrometricum]|uniref:Ubiquitin-like protease family profile domain-containing protein n=1 Tax=Dorcoceras hygrometricum TaxID=472368 RepID=A0A2Z7AU02_9LAMI|nr:hypothetical protein F511_07285 [Dorcoceras hygrometricum]